MKKARLLLACMGILTIIGGVAATKAAKRGQVAICTTTATGVPEVIPDYTTAPIGYTRYCVTGTTTRLVLTRISPAF